MNIVLVTPSLDDGGSQRYISEMANYWVSQNHEVTIIALRVNEIFYTISDKVKIILFDFHYSGKISKLSNGIRVFFKLRKKIKQIQPDFVLSVLSSTNILTLCSTYFLGIKIFVKDVMSPYSKRNKLEKILRKFLYKRAAGVITMTSVAKRVIEEETGAKNIKIIPNPVKNIVIDKKVKKERIILNIGRLVSQKGQKYLLEVCARIKDSEWKFVILGDGPLRDSLKKQIIDLKIEKNIELIGAVKNIDEWLSKAHIFAFTSVSEGWGIALSEAMNAGLPCVSFDCQVGPRDMIKDGENGFLVPVGDVELFSSRIKELMNNSLLREKYSISARKSTKKFKIENISKEVLNFCGH